MNVLRKLFRALGILLALPIVYLIIALILGSIPVNTDYQTEDPQRHIYLNTNGVHLNIIIPRDRIDPGLIEGLRLESEDRYLAFGWGDRQFYLNTPYWSDLELSTALQAMFLKSPTLMHYTRYNAPSGKWIRIPLSEEKFNKLNAYILQSFKLNSDGKKILLPGEGYSHNDHFYEANGFYTGLYTSNTWANEAFKTSGLKACSWTPFDFSLMNKYR